MGSRKTLDIILAVGAAVLAVMGIVSFIMGLIDGQVFAAIFGLFNALVSVVVIIRVLLLARDAHDYDRHIVNREDIDNLKNKMK